MPSPLRWGHLLRHGLLGASLVGAAAGTATAEPCDADVDRSIVAVTIGVAVTPRVGLIGGLEYRRCVDEQVDLMARAELGAGPPRLIAGARVRPFADADYLGALGTEDLGIEAGLAIDRARRPGVHLAATLGPAFFYGAIQGLFPLTSQDVLAETRTAVVGGIAPWSLGGPTTVAGRPIARGDRWIVPDVLARAAAGSAEDRAVRAHFTQAAQLEFSSVWSFLRLAAELHAVGAPAALIAAALDAADDEVAHAELCAQAAGGLALAPLPAALAQPRFTARTPVALAVLAAEAWREGCLNEGAAAEEARLTAAEAEGPVRATLATIARDEAGHAALAWAVLAWLRAVAPDALAALDPIEPAAAAEVAPADPALTRRGVTSPAIAAAARAHAHAAAADRRRALTC